MAKIIDLLIGMKNAFVMDHKRFFRFSWQSVYVDLLLLIDAMRKSQGI
jgi:hypothetical protein